MEVRARRNPAPPSDAGVPGNAPLVPAAPAAKLAERGYRMPGPSEPVRIAFVGQATYFECCSLRSPVGNSETRFFDHRAGIPTDGWSRELRLFEPHVVVAFRPEIIPPGLFHTVPALTLGYLTEPLPRSDKRVHKDLLRRLEYLQTTDPSNFDRIVAFDPMMVVSAGVVAPVWRSVPLPVADELFADTVTVKRDAGPALFVGRSSKHREKLMALAKHQHDLLHIAHGIDSTALLRKTFDQTTIALNIHNEEYPSFENRVSMHLAAGHLLITEPLSPTYGLEPGLDYLEATSPRQFQARIHSALEHPESFLETRIRGRAKAELFRASRVYPRLIHDLVRDVAAFGSERAREW